MEAQNRVVSPFGLKGGPMKTKTRVKAGRLAANHNTTVR